MEDTKKAQLANEYYDLAITEEKIEKKEAYLQIACELDSKYLEQYLEIYQEQVALEDYKGAYDSITKGEEIARKKEIPVNMTVPKILLGRLLDNSNNCLIDQYYGLKKLKEEPLKLYREAIYYVWTKDYELAYEILYYLGCAYPEYDFKVILTLIEKNALKEMQSYQKSKK